MDHSTSVQLEKANKYIFVKKYHRANDILENLLKTPSGHEEVLVHLRYIELAAKQDELDKVMDQYAARLLKNPDDRPLEIAHLLACMHQEKVDIRTTIEAFQNLIKKYGENAACYFGIAFGLEMQGNNERAIYNYEKSIADNSDWYPSYFGLSQLYYNKGDNNNGDHYFYLFEQAAPYNVYGNFDTHRDLSREFLGLDQYEEAEIAIKTLQEWWIDNKGHCPVEIDIFESLSLSDIKERRGDMAAATEIKNRAQELGEYLLLNDSANDEILFFVAKSFEEFGEFAFALRCYKRILKRSGENPRMVQKIGGQFLAMGEYDLAQDLFEDAYQYYPDSPEIRFCILVARLKKTEVNVEEYLIGKERLRQLINTDSDKVEILALLHNLLAKFQEDPEVHQQIGEVYLKLTNRDRAAKHFQKMYELDSRSMVTSLKFAAFLIRYGDAEEALEILQGVEKSPNLDLDQEVELSWLKATYYATAGDPKRSQDLLAKAVDADPWNISYLVQEVINRMQMSRISDELKKPDDVVLKLKSMDERKLNWDLFDEVTKQFADEKIMDVVYVRQKLRYLYSDGDLSKLKTLVATACTYDAQRGSYDFIRLINTNFDSPLVYWSLGVLYKELWQLEVAAMWFEQAIFNPKIDTFQKADCYVELADCYVWLSKNIRTAVEFATTAIELEEEPSLHARAVLAHALLKDGQVKKAQAYLNHEDHSNIEQRYLSGLLEYRNGAQKRANEIWKPLLTVRSENIRVHNIKQEVLRFYFDHQPYLDLKYN